MLNDFQEIVPLNNEIKLWLKFSFYINQSLKINNSNAVIHFHFHSSIKMKLIDEVGNMCYYLNVVSSFNFWKWE